MMQDECNNLLLFPLTEASGQRVESDSDWSTVEKPFKPDEPLVAVDFETYYSDKYSLANMTTWEYTHHPAFDPYLVALVWWDGSCWKEWAGHPKDAPWHDIAGITWLSHNAGFDELVYRTMISNKEIKPVNPKVWLCTADMCAFLQAGRSLAAAAKNLLNLQVSKEVRDKMKFGGASAQEMRDYALDDSRICAELFVKHGHKWSYTERFLSVRTRVQGWTGVGFNRKGCEEAIKHLEMTLDLIAKQLPWYGKGPVTSYKCYVAACYSVGIEPATSLAADSDSSYQWEQKYGDKYPWISLIRRYTKARQTLGSLQLFISRSRENDTIPFSMVYSKAMPTRRWQHSERFRIQNLDKDPCEGISIRNMITPRPGYVFAIVDLSQIEPRVLNWMANNHRFLEECAKGISPYEAHARASMGYNDPGRLKDVDPSAYALAKVRVLALGYGAGPLTFQEMARTMCGLTIFEKEKAAILPNGDTISVKQLNYMLKQGHDPHLIEAYNAKKIGFLPSAIEAVRDFRDNSPQITSFWEKSENDLRSNIGRNHCVVLPSGYTLRYFDVKEAGGELKAWVVRNSVNVKDLRYLYGGKLVENAVQAESRNVFADCLFRIEQNHPKLCRIVFTVHDEAVVEVPESHAEEGLAAVLHEMSTAPSWASGLPVAAEGTLSPYYKK